MAAPGEVLSYFEDTPLCFTSFRIGTNLDGMKRFIIAVCAMWLSFSATAQTNPPLASPPPATPTETAPAKLPEPLSATTPDNTRYLNNTDMLPRCEARLAEFADKPCDIIFIGDSITEGWLGSGKALWEKDYEPRHALDFGIGGDKTQNVLWRLNNMDIRNLKPKVAVVLIGTNNLANNPHEIADGVRAILANTQEAFPGVKIILVSIMPNARANDKMMQVDSIIRGYADDSSVYYLNLVPLMPPVTTITPDGQTDTNWKGLSRDHLHPDASGYQIWDDAMEPLLSKLLAGG
jgi:lysophospholipase L1-like esterase